MVDELTVEEFFRRIDAGFAAIERERARLTEEHYWYGHDLKLISSPAVARYVRLWECACGHSNYELRLGANHA